MNQLEDLLDVHLLDTSHYSVKFRRKIETTRIVPSQLTRQVVPAAATSASTSDAWEGELIDNSDSDSQNRTLSIVLKSLHTHFFASPLMDGASSVRRLSETIAASHVNALTPAECVGLGLVKCHGVVHRQMKLYLAVDRGITPLLSIVGPLLSEKREVGKIVLLVALLQVSEGLLTLHQRPGAAPIAHGNVKLETVFVMEDGSVALSGIGSLFSSALRYLIDSVTPSLVTAALVDQLRHHAHYYLSLPPELTAVFVDTSTSASSPKCPTLEGDIFSFGVLCYRLTHGGRGPFDQGVGGGSMSPAVAVKMLHDILKSRREINNNNATSIISPRFDALMVQCLHFDPAKRPLIRKVVTELRAMVDDTIANNAIMVPHDQHGYCRWVGSVMLAHLGSVAEQSGSVVEGTSMTAKELWTRVIEIDEQNAEAYAKLGKILSPDSKDRIKLSKGSFLSQRDCFLYSIHFSFRRKHMAHVTAEACLELGSHLGDATVRSDLELPDDLQPPNITAINCYLCALAFADAVLLRKQILLALATAMKRQNLTFVKSLSLQDCFVGAVDCAAAFVGRGECFADESYFKRAVEFDPKNPVGWKAIGGFGRPDEFVTLSNGRSISRADCLCLGQQPHPTIDLFTYIFDKVADWISSVSTMVAQRRGNEWLCIARATVTDDQHDRLVIAARDSSQGAEPVDSRRARKLLELVLEFDDGPLFSKEINQRTSSMLHYLVSLVTPLNWSKESTAGDLVRVIESAAVVQFGHQAAARLVALLTVCIFPSLCRDALHTSEHLSSVRSSGSDEKVHAALLEHVSSFVKYCQPIDSSGSVLAQRHAVKLLLTRNGISQAETLFNHAFREMTLYLQTKGQAKYAALLSYDTTDVEWKAAGVKQSAPVTRPLLSLRQGQQLTSSLMEDAEIFARGCDEADRCWLDGELRDVEGMWPPSSFATASERETLRIPLTTRVELVSRGDTSSNTHVLHAAITDGNAPRVHAVAKALPIGAYALNSVFTRLIVQELLAVVDCQNAQYPPSTIPRLYGIVTRSRKPFLIMERCVCQVAELLFPLEGVLTDKTTNDTTVVVEPEVEGFVNTSSLVYRAFDDPSEKVLPQFDRLFANSEPSRGSLSGGKPTGLGLTVTTSQAWECGTGDQSHFISVTFVLLKVALALDALHKRNVAHGNIKLSNVMVKQDGEVCLVGSFSAEGIKSYSTPMLAAMASHPIVLPAPPLNLPPEVLRLYWKYDAFVATTMDMLKCDVFSFGMLIFALLNGGNEAFDEFHPFVDAKLYEDKRRRIDLRHDRPTIPSDLESKMPRVLRYLLTDCWHEDPQKRPAADAVVGILQQCLDSICPRAALLVDHWREVCSARVGITVSDCINPRHVGRLAVNAGGAVAMLLDKISADTMNATYFYELGLALVEEALEFVYVPPIGSNLTVEGCFAFSCGLPSCPIDAYYQLALRLPATEITANDPPPQTALSTRRECLIRLLSRQRRHREALVMLGDMLRFLNDKSEASVFVADRDQFVVDLLPENDNDFPESLTKRQCYEEALKCDCDAEGSGKLFCAVGHALLAAVGDSTSALEFDLYEGKKPPLTAHECFIEALLREPSAEAFAGLGITLHGKGIVSVDLEGMKGIGSVTLTAESCFRRALTMDEGNIDALIGLAEQLSRQRLSPPDDLMDVRSLCLRCINLDDNNVPCGTRARRAFSLLAETFAWEQYRAAGKVTLLDGRAVGPAECNLFATSNDAVGFVIGSFMIVSEKHANLGQELKAKFAESTNTEFGQSCQSLSLSTTARKATTLQASHNAKNLEGARAGQIVQHVLQLKTGKDGPKQQTSPDRRKSTNFRRKESSASTPLSDTQSERLLSMAKVFQCAVPLTPGGGLFPRVVALASSVIALSATAIAVQGPARRIGEQVSCFLPLILEIRTLEKFKNAALKRFEESLQSAREALAELQFDDSAGGGFEAWEGIGLVSWFLLLLPRISTLQCELEKIFHTLVNLQIDYGDAIGLDGADLNQDFAKGSWLDTQTLNSKCVNYMDRALASPTLSEMEKDSVRAMQSRLGNEMEAVLEAFEGNQFSASTIFQRLSARDDTKEWLFSGTLLLLTPSADSTRKEVASHAGLRGSILTQVLDADGADTADVELHCRVISIPKKLDFGPFTVITEKVMRLMAWDHPNLVSCKGFYTSKPENDYVIFEDIFEAFPSILARCPLRTNTLVLGLTIWGVTSALQYIVVQSGDQATQHGEVCLSNLMLKPNGEVALTLSIEGQASSPTLPWQRNDSDIDGIGKLLLELVSGPDSVNEVSHSGSGSFQCIPAALRDIAERCSDSRSKLTVADIRKRLKRTIMTFISENDDPQDFIVKEWHSFCRNELGMSARALSADVFSDFFDDDEGSDILARVGALENVLHAFDEHREETLPSQSFLGRSMNRPVTNLGPYVGLARHLGVVFEVTLPELKKLVKGTRTMDAALFASFVYTKLRKLFDKAVDDTSEPNERKRKRNKISAPELIVLLRSMPLANVYGRRQIEIEKWVATRQVDPKLSDDCDAGGVTWDEFVRIFDSLCTLGTVDHHRIRNTYQHLLHHPHLTSSERADIMTAIGESFLAGADYDSARDSFLQAIAVDPTCAAAYLFLGEAQEYSIAQPLEEDTLVSLKAENTWRSFDDRNPQSPLDCYKKAAEICLSLLANLAESSVEGEADDDNAMHRRRAAKLTVCGILSQAFVCIGGCLNPDQLVDIKTPAKASPIQVLSQRECFLEALRHDPRNSSAYLHLGHRMEAEERVFLPSGIKHSPRDCFISAIKYDPRCGHAYLLLGLSMSSTFRERVYLFDGREATEMFCYRQALKLLPPNDEGFTVAQTLLDAYTAAVAK